MRVLVTALLDDYKLKTKLIGLTNSKLIRDILLVRRLPLKGMNNVSNINPSGIWARWKILYEIWRLITIMRLIFQNKVDVLIGIQLQLHGLQIAFSGWMTDLPFVLQVIGSDLYLFLKNPWKRPFLTWAIKRASAIIVLGSDSRQILRKIGISSNRIVEIQNYQDDSRFSYKPLDKRWDLLFVGNLITRKRLHDLIGILPDIFKKIGVVRLGIVGDGVERKPLEELAQTLKLMENIEFIGHVTDVENYMNASRAVILVSKAEGLPAAAVEAMLCGLPVILTDVGNVRSVFTHGDNALLVKLGDKKELIDAIVKLFSDKAIYRRLHLGALKARGNYLQRWNLKEQIRTWEKILRLTINLKKATSFSESGLK